jgi:colanic acid biosynthesis protein WcaH
VAKANGWLDADTFQAVVASTPLISIDLLVENEQGEYLLGLRNNRPAQGHWFVPGGRVQKSETLDDAFKLLTREELGIELKRSQAQFKGIYEHFYDDSVFGENSDTHYIVLAYLLKLSNKSVQLDVFQHADTAWIKQKNLHLLQTHPFTLDYFT